MYFCTYSGHLLHHGTSNGLKMIWGKADLPSYIYSLYIGKFSGKSGCFSGSCYNPSPCDKMWLTGIFLQLITPTFYKLFISYLAYRVTVLCRLVCSMSNENLILLVKLVNEPHNWYLHFVPTRRWFITGLWQDDDSVLLLILLLDNALKACKQRLFNVIVIIMFHDCRLSEMKEGVF